MELKMLYQLVEAFLSCYAANVENIYEFGCGTGHHLLKIREFFPHVTLTGLDWATSSQDIIKKVAQDLKDSSLHARKFNFFKPDQDLAFEANSIAVTIAALEQVGVNHKEFVNFLAESNIDLIFNFEPIEEVLSDKNLLESLSKKYFRKRNYLSGYLTYLRQLADLGKIQILLEQRAHFGSFFIEGYTVIIWKPIKN